MSIQFSVSYIKLASYIVPFHTDRNNLSCSLQFLNKSLHNPLNINANSFQVQDAYIVDSDCMSMCMLTNSLFIKLSRNPSNNGFLNYISL